MTAILVAEEARAARPAVTPASTSARKDARLTILETAAAAGEGHCPSALSIIDIVEVLYRDVLRADDRLVFGKGHGCLALYAILAERGIITQADLDSFGQRDSILGGHPDSRKVPGVYASTGSLGHGLPIAVGAAMAKPGRVFCLVGDQECNEGSIWEAALVAAHRNLGNLCCIVDFNRSGEDICRMGSIAEKFAAFGWATVEIDGHDEPDLTWALSFAPTHKPLCIVARTVKGKGIPEMEVDPRAWHHKSPDPAQLAAMRAALAA